MKSSLIALAVLSASLSAFATNGNNSNGNGGCGVGQQTNGCGSTPTGGTGGAGGNATANGYGGQGGAGGIGLGGAGGSVIGSGNSSNLNNNSNRNTANGGNATGGNSTATGGNSASASSASNGGNTTGNNSNTIHVDGDTTNVPRTAASAASVIGSSPSADVCARPGFGLSLQGPGAGAAWSSGTGESDTCEARADAVNLKYTGASAAVIKARHCMSPKMAQAYADAGEPCKSAIKTAAVAPVVASSEPSDPWVRARLGLPALK